MTKLYATLAVFCFSIAVGAQCFVQIQCNPVSCNGACDGSATAFANGVPPFSYAWSQPGPNSQTITGLCAGMIMVVVTDSLGCQATATCVITSPAVLQAGINNVINPSCPTCCDGSMSALPSGGTSPYTYNWTGPNGFSSSLPTISNLCAGTYSLCVTDAQGCISCTTMQIVAPQPNCAVQLQCTNVSCFGGCDGAATAYPIGTAPFNYIWSVSLSTAQSVSGLCAGQVQVTMIDSTGCQATATCLITQPTQLNAYIFNVVNPSCPTCCDGSMSGTASGGTPNYNYTWWTPQGPPLPMSTISNLCAGTYTLCITDANGCTSCDTQSVSFPTSVNPLHQQNSMSVTGNAEGQFTVDAQLVQPAAGEIVVTNALGQTIRREHFEGSAVRRTIDLSGEAAGIYFVSVILPDGTMSRKILKN